MIEFFLCEIILRVKKNYVILFMSNSLYISIVVRTSQPSNEAESQLYRVLQRASLLDYYDTLLEMGKTKKHNLTICNITSNNKMRNFIGGDDLQQLCDAQSCEARDDEFLEIMALVGMASKPLHVRRLQKVLHEWAINPSFFQTPITGGVGNFTSFKSQNFR